MIVLVIDEVGTIEELVFKYGYYIPFCVAMQVEDTFDPHVGDVFFGKGKSFVVVGRIFHCKSCPSIYVREIVK